MDSAVIDFSDTAARRELLNQLNQLRGRQRVEVVRYRPRRSDRQNRYYWPCVAKPFADYLSEQEAEPVTAEYAHGILKAKFLTVDVFDRRTGEVLGCRVRSTTELTTVEFNDYVERCIAWLAEFFGIEVQPPIRIEEEAA